MLARRGPAHGTSVTQAGEVRSARIESLRAVAAVAVLVAHLWGAAHAWGPETVASFADRLVFSGGVGVWLFFALSGYLLFWPFARERFAGRGGIDLRRYALNRALRILPLYYVVLVAVMLLQEGGGSLEQWWRYGLMASNLSESTIDGAATVIGPMWSVAVELQFYALLPLVAYALFRLSRGSLRRAALMLAALGAASLALRIATLHAAADPNIPLAHSLPGTFFFFVAGMLAALLRIAWERRPPGALAGPLGSADLWLLASAPFWLYFAWQFRYDSVLALGTFLVVAACVLPLRPGRLVRLVEWRPLALVGIASYSLYLWHMPIVEAAARGAWLGGRFPALLVVVLPLCLLVAFASYRLVEAPFLRLRRRWSPASARQTAPVPSAAGHGRQDGDLVPVLD